MYFDEVENILEAKPVVDDDYTAQYDERNKILNKKKEEDAEKIAKYSGNKKVWRDAVSKKFKKYDPNISDNLKGKSIKISHAYNSSEEKGDIIYKIAKKEIKKVINGNPELKNAQETIQNNIIRKNTNNLSNIDNNINDFESIKNNPNAKFIIAKNKSNDHLAARAQNNYLWNRQGNFYVTLPKGSITYGSSNAWDGILRKDGVYHPVELKNTNKKNDVNVNLNLFISQVNKLKKITNKIGKPIIISDSGVDFDYVKASRDEDKMDVHKMNVEQLYAFFKKQNLNEDPKDDIYMSNVKGRLSKKINKINRSIKNGHDISSFNNYKGFLDSMQREASQYLYALKKNNRKEWLSKNNNPEDFIIYNSSEFNKELIKLKASTLDRSLNSQETTKLFNFLQYLKIPVETVMANFKGK